MPFLFRELVVEDLNPNPEPDPNETETEGPLPVSKPTENPPLLVLSTLNEEKNPSLPFLLCFRPHF